MLITPQRLTQHSAGHQDVKQCLCIPAVVKLGARSIEELRDRVQISASLIQALYDTFLKLSRVKSLLFICESRRTSIRGNFKKRPQAEKQMYIQRSEKQGHLFSSF